MASASLPRLAIVGGGMGGVSTAYLCDSGWATDLFEARPSLGGNAATVAVRQDGEEVLVELGAESFNPGTHPMFWCLLQEIGAIPSAGSAGGVLIEMPGSLSVFDAATRRLLLASTHPLRNPWYAVNLLCFTRAARLFVSNDPGYEVAVGEWLDGLRLSRTFKREVLEPWLASLTCYSVETLRTQSLLAFLLLFVHVFPKCIFGRPKTYCSRIGLGGILAMLVDECRNLSVHTGAPVSKVQKIDGAWFVDTPGRRHGPYDKVVVNAPPRASRQFLTGVPQALLDVLGEHEYYPARMLIHEDPTYMPADRRDWCMHNAAVDGDTCEASIWLGAFRKHPKTGEPVHLFKSWASDRAVQPERILAERTFHHLLLTPDTLRATRELQNWQGHEGLFFAGHFTTLTDLQETALYSGVAVAKTLHPTSQRLHSLEQRLARASHTSLSYEVRH